MTDVFSQTIQASRIFRKSPAFATSALAILTLGIGANTAIFSVVNAVLLKPLPFPDADEVVTLSHVPPPAAFPGLKTFSVSLANYLDWRKQNSVFASMSAWAPGALQMGGSRPQELKVTISDAGFFDVLRVKPAFERVFDDSECQPGRDNVIVLSLAAAQEHFGSAASAVGKQMTLNNRTYHVIGVMPASFQVKSWFPASTDGWVPTAWTDKDRAVRGNHNYSVIGRLRSGVSVQRAQAEMNVISDRLAREYPEEDKGWGALVRSLRDDLVGDVRPALLALLGAVSFVLLIACANTANLVIARTIARRKELAIRVALGAGTRQIVRAVLIETILLALLGGLLGLLVAEAGQKLVVRALADLLPRATEVTIDAHVLAFTFAASMLTGTLVGLLAGVRAISGDLQESLKQGMGRSDSYSGGRRTRSALVVSEVALAIVLLIGAGLMVRTLWALQATQPGFDPVNAVTMTVPIPKAQNGRDLNLFYNTFLPKVAALPGVESVGAIDSLPMSGGSEQPITVEGRPAEVFALQRNVSVRQVTPNYFRTMHIPFRAGRDFQMADQHRDKVPAVISQAMANLFWPGENAIGKRFRISFTPDVVREVIGVVGDVRERGLDVLEPVAMLYTPIPTEEGLISLVVRTNRDSAKLVSAITHVLHEINPELPVRDVRTMEELVATTLSQYRFSMWLFTALAALAFLLAAVGIYSVLSYSVRTRVREIGVRMALGAEPADVLRIVIAEGMKPALVGMAVGFAGAIALGGVLSRLIFGVKATDPPTYAIVMVLLAMVALAACIVPAYRATRVQPMHALQNE
jgi:putative ABC transport system permease protein